MVFRTPRIFPRDTYRHDGFVITVMSNYIANYRRWVDINVVTPWGETYRAAACQQCQHPEFTFKENEDTWVTLSIYEMWFDSFVSFTVDYRRPLLNCASYPWPLDELCKLFSKLVTGIKDDYDSLTKTLLEKVYEIEDGLTEDIYNTATSLEKKISAVVDDFKADVGHYFDDVYIIITGLNNDMQKALDFLNNADEWFDKKINQYRARVLRWIVDSFEDIIENILEKEVKE